MKLMGVGMVADLQSQAVKREYFSIIKTTEPNAVLIKKNCNALDKWHSKFVEKTCLLQNFNRK